MCCAVVRAPASLFVSTCCPGFLCDARRTAAMLALQSASAALGVATSSLRRRANAVEPLAATTRRTTASSPSTASKAAAAAAAQAPTGKGKSSTASVSLARQLYSAEAEAAVNDQINVEVRVCDPPCSRRRGVSPKCVAVPASPRFFSHGSPPPSAFLSPSTPSASPTPPCGARLSAGALAQPDASTQVILLT